MRVRVAFSLIVVLAVLGTATVNFADVPQRIDYQGVLQLDGEPVTTTVSVKFSIYDVLTGGTELWTETRSVTPDIDGVFSVILGENTPITDVVFVAPDRWLGIKVEAEPELSPRTELVTAPYSFRVATVDGSTGGTISGDVTIQSDLDVGGDIQATGAIQSGSSIVIDGVNDQITATSGTISFVDENLTTTGTVEMGSFKMAPGTEGYVLTSDGSGIGAWQPPTDNGAEWSVTDSVLYTNKYWGIARGGADNVLYGGNAHTMVNLGIACTTGTNTYSHIYSTVSGGCRNVADGEASTVGGGYRNRTTMDDCIIGGGRFNQATGIGATVAGGTNNIAGSGYSSTVGGGIDNTASGAKSTVSGGMYNTASGQYSMILGGHDNTASGECSQAIGCNVSALADYSFAGGNGAIAIHEGTFVWADASGEELQSTEPNQFLIRASGGTKIYSKPDLKAGVTIHPGASAWAVHSDRNLKENFTPIDRKDLLEKIAALPIMKWNYMAQSENVKHIGPVAQDFYALFGVGDDDVTISTIDPAGVALAAIQELYKKTQKIEKLETQLAEMQTMLQQLFMERQ